MDTMNTESEKNYSAPEIKTVALNSGCAFLKGSNEPTGEGPGRW